MLQTVAEDRRAMAAFAQMKDLEVWYSHMDVESKLNELSAELKQKQVKTAEKQLAKASVLEEFISKSRFKNHGQRVVTGQRLMQSESDIFLGWVHVDAGLDGKARDFYVRQLKDWKGSAEIERMKPKALAVYGQLCGWMLARAHARSGDRVAIAAYLGNSDGFDRAILNFSRTYAEQNEQDYQAEGGGQVRQDHGPNWPVTRRTSSRSGDPLLQPVARP